MLVEIKARFDEEANIVWARKLERAGAHVVYGLVGLKTHSKTALVVRREGSGLRRYVHIGTGNYNPKTARLYVDLGLLTARPEIGADVTDLFNVLTGLSRQRTFRRLLVAPHSLRSRFLQLVDREVAHAQAGRPARIVLKLNAIVDVASIEALYDASQAGVEIDLIIRAGCSLQPGIPGVSDNIRVRSIIGEFLEHSRIWSFENGGDREWYIGSADLMDRNLDRRVEAIVPVEDAEARTRLAHIVELMLADDRRSWQLLPDATWVRTEALNGGPGHHRHVRDAQGPGAGPRSHRRHPASAGRRRRLAGPARVTETAEPAGRTKPAPRPIEVELKYRVLDLPAAERYLSAATIGPFTGASQARSTQLEDRYVDTADRAMERAGFAVRLRSSGSGVVVSVKSRSQREGPGGAVGREEMEGPADRTAGPPDWPASDARSLVMELAGDAPLVEVVTIRQLRRKRQLRDGSTRVELSLDEVDVVASKRVVGRFIELEAELTKGDEARLVGLASAFGGDPALKVANGSKLDAALAAVQGAKTKHGGGSSSKSRSDDADEDAELAIEGEAALLDDRESGANGDPRPRVLCQCRPTTSRRPPTTSTRRSPAPRRPMPLACRSARPRASPATTTSPRPGARSCASTSPGCWPVRPGRGPARITTELHAMRVATRRQRAAWRVFGSSFRVARTKRFRNGLREIASRLGAVRDLDVLLEAADEYRADLPVTEQRALEPLLARLAGPPRGRPGAAESRARLGRLPPLGRRLPRLRAHRGCRRPAGRAGPATPGPRHGAVAHLGRL